MRIHLGDYRDVLAGVRDVDAVICDPPYSARTHDDESMAENMLSVTGQATRTRLSYGAFTPQDVAELVGTWAPRCRGWFCAFTSHDLIPAYEEAYEEAGRYVFAPVPWIAKRPRLIGDGPSSWCCYLMVSRPRSVAYSRWGCLPGAYLPGPKDVNALIGGKPLWLMRAIVGDYTNPGDRVCDPCAGYGTTLQAARQLGCLAVGAEVDPKTHAEATRRFDLPFTPYPHPRAARQATKPAQAALF